jgi:hypothetical protein
LKGLEQFLYFPWAMIFGSSTTFVGLLTVAVRSDFQVSPLKRTSWNSVKLTALNLGDSFARWSFDVFVFRYRVKVADLVFEKQKVQNQPALDGSDQTRLSLLGKTVAPAQRGRFWPSIGEQTVRKLGLSVSFEEKFYLAFP